MYIAPVLAALIALLICLLAQYLAEKLGVMDIPDGDRKRHKMPTPLIGGLAISVPMLGVGIFFAVSSEATGLYIALSVSILVAFLIGFADDRHDLSPALRLFLSFVLCIGILSADPNLVLGILHFSFDYSFSLGSWAWPFTLLAVVGFIYAFNMTDGMDGLAMGQGLIWSILLLIMGTNDLQWFLIILSSVLVITLFFNLRKKLFLGDSGAYALSTIVGVMMIYSHSHTQTIKADMITFWLLIPVLDCLRLILTRTLRRVSPLSPDNLHLHNFLELLLPRALVVPLILAYIALSGAMTIIFPQQTIVWLAISLVVYLAIIAAAERKRKIIGC